MTRTTWIGISLLVLAGCQQAPAANQSICQALAPAFPIAFHGSSDTTDTIARIRQANARYKAACG